MEDKNILDKFYKDWSGESHAINSGRPIHDSSGAMDFASYCIDEIIEKFKPNWISVIHRLPELMCMEEQFKEIITRLIDGNKNKTPFTKLSDIELTIEAMQEAFELGRKYSIGDKPDCEHNNTKFQNIRCNVCPDCGTVIEIDT